MRRSIRTLGVAAALVALSACSGGPAATTSGAPATSAPTTSAATDYTGVTLTMWVDQDRFKAVDAAAKQFTAATKAFADLLASAAGLKELEAVGFLAP